MERRLTDRDINYYRYMLNKNLCKSEKQRIHFMKEIEKYLYNKLMIE